MLTRDAKVYANQLNLIMSFLPVTLLSKVSAAGRERAGAPVLSSRYSDGNVPYHLSVERYRLRFDDHLVGCRIIGRLKTHTFDTIWSGAYANSP